MHSPEKSIALLSLVLFAVQPTIGQGDPNCEQRTVIATVADARGVLQADLTSDNFKVIYKGGVTKLLHATYSKGPRRIVLLLDVSGSMSGFASGNSKKWQVAREAASELIAALPPGSKASLMTFSEKADIKSALSPDLRPIQDWLNSEAAHHPESFHGRTALYAAVQSALAQLEPTEPGDAIYVITDGGENASRVSESKLECALGSSGVRVFALIVPEEFGSFEDERGGWVELLDLSKHSGGFVEVAGLSGAASMLSDRKVPYDNRMKEQIRLHSQRLSRKIEAFYSITLQVPENPDKPQRLDINVVDGRGRHRKDLQLEYPRRMFPCRVESVQR